MRDLYKIELIEEAEERQTLLGIHRQEFVASINGVSFINDAGAVSVNATWFSLESRNRKVVLILGRGNILADNVFVDVCKEKVKTIIYYGEDFATLKDVMQGSVSEILRVNNLTDAVLLGSVVAQEGEEVLFSCPFGDLSDMEAESREFIMAVNRL